MTQSGKHLVRGAIEAKLQAAFAPEFLQVIDESHEHAGHAGHAGDDEGASHFRVKLVSAGFSGKSRVERHRAVNALLAEELAGGVHALALHLAAPGE